MRPTSSTLNVWSGWQAKSVEMDINLHDLREAAFTTWNHMSASLLRMLISAIPKRIFEVVDNDLQLATETSCWAFPTV